MSDKHLHIVCFDVPYPADYGGVIDVFYRIKALHSLGIKIHLHCFEYGRGEQKELNKYCVEVNYYKRLTGLAGFSFSMPYIVKSRANKKLLTNLSKDDYPILLEGIHTTYFLNTGGLNDRKILVRIYNVEYEYYEQLSNSETSLFKRIYYKYESKLLKPFENKIANAGSLLAISQGDLLLFQELFNAKDIKYLPPFINSTNINIKEGKGKYCLYHGNLSVAENEKAALQLINLADYIQTPIIIAGKKSSFKLKKEIEKYNNVKLVNDPTDEGMTELIKNAQINILPSFNSTGIKLKLLNALFNGRHCLTNRQAVKGTSLESYCEVTETEKDIVERIKYLFNIPFTESDIEKRKGLLNEFDNIKNAEMLMTWIY